MRLPSFPHGDQRVFGCFTGKSEQQGKAQKKGGSKGKWLSIIVGLAAVAWAIRRVLSLTLPLGSNEPKLKDCC